MSSGTGRKVYGRTNSQVRSFLKNHSECVAEGLASYQIQELVDVVRESGITTHQLGSIVDALSKSEAVWAEPLRRVCFHCFDRHDKPTFEDSEDSLIYVLASHLCAHIPDFTAVLKSIIGRTFINSYSRATLQMVKPHSDRTLEQRRKKVEAIVQEERLGCSAEQILEVLDALDVYLERPGRKHATLQTLITLAKYLSLFSSITDSSIKRSSTITTLDLNNKFLRKILVQCEHHAKFINLIATVLGDLSPSGGPQVSAGSPSTATGSPVVTGSPFEAIVRQVDSASADRISRSSASVPLNSTGAAAGAFLPAIDEFIGVKRAATQPSSRASSPSVPATTTPNTQTPEDIEEHNSPEHRAFIQKAAGVLGQSMVTEYIYRPEHTATPDDLNKLAQMIRELESAQQGKVYQDQPRVYAGKVKALIEALQQKLPIAAARIKIFNERSTQGQHIPNIKVQAARSRAVLVRMINEHIYCHLQADNLPPKDKVNLNCTMLNVSVGPTGREFLVRLIDMSGVVPIEYHYLFAYKELRPE